MNELNSIFVEEASKNVCLCVCVCMSATWLNIAMNYTLTHQPALLQYNPFTHTHSDTSTLGFVCGLCLSSLVTFTLFSLMRPIRLTALCVESSLLWCGAFHYADQLEL